MKHPNFIHNRPHTEEAKAKMRAAKLGKRMSPSTEFKKGHAEIPGRIEHIPRGEQHYKWKEKPGYMALHTWVIKTLGQPETCENCGETGLSGHKIQWANLSGEYRRDPTDWARLCARCHQLIDDSKRKSWITRKALA